MAANLEQPSLFDASKTVYPVLNQAFELQKKIYEEGLETARTAINAGAQSGQQNLLNWGIEQAQRAMMPYYDVDENGALLMPKQPFDPRTAPVEHYDRMARARAEAALKRKEKTDPNSLTAEERNFLNIYQNAPKLSGAIPPLNTATGSGMPIIGLMGPALRMGIQQSSAAANRAMYDPKIKQVWEMYAPPGLYPVLPYGR